MSATVTPIDTAREGEGIPAEVLEYLRVKRPDIGNALIEAQYAERRQAEAPATSWEPVPLGPILDGDARIPEPDQLDRSDGPCLLYRGKVHQVVAEPEAGKGWLVCRASRDALAAGETVLYIDFEDEAGTLVERSVALGTDPQAIRERFVYIRPDEPLAGPTRQHLDAALERKPALVVIDGVTEAMTLHGLDLSDNRDIARWLELLPRPAQRSGAAVVLVDHVVKDREARGRYAIGGQHKLAGIDVAYGLDAVEPFGRGRDGLVKVAVHKDRPGHVRTYAEGNQIALMRLHSDPDTGAVAVTLNPPDATGDEGEFRPTVLMERISQAVEVNPGLVTRDIRALSGKATALDQALRLLVAEGFVSVERKGQAHHHHSVRPYRRADDEGGSE
ncbi:MAG: AAA family ATPase [Thermoleophilaceae bacterium]